jgi:hypothetical protein
MRFGLEFLRDQHHRHKHQQPQQRIATDFLKEQFQFVNLRSQCPRWFPFRNRTKVR